MAGREWTKLLSTNEIQFDVNVYQRDFPSMDFWDNWSRWIKSLTLWMWNFSNKY